MTHYATAHHRLGLGRLLWTCLLGSLCWHLFSVFLFSSVLLVEIGGPSSIVGDGDRQGQDEVTMDLTALFESTEAPMQRREVLEVPIPVIKHESLVSPAIGLVDIVVSKDKDAELSMPSELDEQDAEGKAMVHEPSQEDIRPNAQPAPISENTSSAASKFQGEITSKAGKPIFRRILFKPPLPRYPEWAQREGKEFSQRIRIHVLPSGRVERVQTMLSSGSLEVDTIGLQYFRRWRFERAIFSDKVTIYYSTMKFLLSD